MPGWGKDGSFYKDDNELRKANNKWLQQEKQRQELEKQNKLKEEEIRQYENVARESNLRM